MSASKQFLAAILAPFAHWANRTGGTARRLWAYARLKASLPRLDASVVVLGMPELHGSRAIQLGRNLFLYRDLYLETQAQGKIRIDDNVVMSRGVHVVAFAGIEIGAGSMIGEYASLRDANHHFGAGLELRSAGHTAARITLGRNVWIGRGATVLPGVTIGDGAVVGANAVVTHDVVAGDVVAGVPAKSIRRRLA
jgi:acetyltransferase-like isoleucine patch superfamily enzyme